MLAQHGIVIFLYKLKSKIQTSQNKCIRFCLQLGKMSHISQEEFETINWLPIKERYNQCVNSVALEYFDNQCPHYLNELFMKAQESSSLLKNSYQKLQQPFFKFSTGQTALSFIGPALWNKVNAFKQNLKRHYLKELVSKILSLLISIV